MARRLPVFKMITAPNIVVARGFWQRFRGLMCSQPLANGEALLIPHCASVHTFFMRYPLDLVYLDAQGTVVRLVQQLPPWRMSHGGRQAMQTLEMAAGEIARQGIRVGDQLPALGLTETHRAY